jgi:hypothetical protein
MTFKSHQVSRRRLLPFGAFFHLRKEREKQVSLLNWFTLIFNFPENGSD